MAGWEEIGFPTGSIEAPSGQWSGSQGLQGVYVRQTQQSKLGQEHHKPESEKQGAAVS